MRLLLDRARVLGKDFDAAYEFAFSRIRWPHDTAHRREWKALLGDYSAAREVGIRQIDVTRSLEVWRAAYYRQPVDSRFEAIRHLLPN